MVSERFTHHDSPMGCAVCDILSIYGIHSEHIVGKEEKDPRSAAASEQPTSHKPGCPDYGFVIPRFCDCNKISGQPTAAQPTKSKEMFHSFTQWCCYKEGWEDAVKSLATPTAAAGSPPKWTESELGSRIRWLIAKYHGNYSDNRNDKLADEIMAALQGEPGGEE